LLSPYKTYKLVLFIIKGDAWVERQRSKELEEDEEEFRAEIQLPHQVYYLILFCILYYFYYMLKKVSNIYEIFIISCYKLKNIINFL
jgi:hypothetical protein